MTELFAPALRSTDTKLCCEETGLGVHSPVGNDILSAMNTADLYATTTEEVRSLSERLATTNNRARVLSLILRAAGLMLMREDVEAFRQTLTALRFEDVDARQ